MALPWFADISYVVGGFTLFGLEPAPFFFLAMGAVLCWLVTRRLFVLPPIARDALLDVIPDAVLVLDGAGTLVEVNRAARRLAGLPKRRAAGPLSAVPLLRELVEAAAALGPGGSREFFFAPAERYFEVGDVPLKQAESQVGRLLLFRDVTDRKQVELRLQQTLASLQRQLESNLVLQKQLREQATRDPLTGTYNRRFFDELRPLLLADADARRQPVAAILIDLDRFKLINDRFGHLAGDKVLAELGERLLRSVRADDYVFRIGGEEFLVLLPGVGAEVALERAESWRQTFAEDGERAPGQPVAATFSAGIAAYPDDAGDWDELLRRADAALYRAKQAGRDRCVIWRELPTD